MDKYYFNKLKPFKWFLLQNFPFIEEDFDALTNYQLFCKLGEEINKIIKSQNNVGQEMETVVNQFIALQNYVNNYFNNLDVQEEINNKLDDMVEQGTLQEIIADYLNSRAIFGFDNVSDMQNATNLINGSFAKTLGYHTKNDGGTSLYKIRTITNDDIVDNAYIIPLYDNTLIAELIYNTNINPIQFGCYGDGTNNDTTNLQKAITFCENKKLKLTSTGNKSYKITSTLNVDTLICDFNNAVIKSDNNINLITINSTNYYGQLEKIKFDCTNVNSAIYIQNGRKKTFKDLIFENISHYGFYYNAGYEILLTDSHFKANGSANTVGIYCNSSDSKFENIIMIDCQKAIVNRGLNFFNFIHAWILTHNIVENSIFADLKSNRSYFNQCYSDTYGITFNCDGGQFVSNQLEVFLNDSIWTSDLPQPHVVYFTTQENRSIFNQLNNSRLNGVRSSQHIKLSNEDISLIQLNNNNKVWVDNYVGIVGQFTGFGSNVLEVYENQITLENGIVTFDLVLKLQVSPNDTRSITSSNLPDYFQPNVPYNGNCINSGDRWGAGQNSYLFINTNLQVTASYVEGATVRYLKCHGSYKNSKFANI